MKVSNFDQTNMLSYIPPYFELQKYSNQSAYSLVHGFLLKLAK